jgi:hypothetical protein
MSENRKSNAVELDFEAIREALRMNLADGDCKAIGEILGNDESTPRKYLDGRRPIESDKGKTILNATARRIIQRMKRDEAARLLAEADALS